MRQISRRTAKKLRYHRLTRAAFVLFALYYIAAIAYISVAMVMAGKYRLGGLMVGTSLIILMMLGTIARWHRVHDTDQADPVEMMLGLYMGLSGMQMMMLTFECI